MPQFTDAARVEELDTAKRVNNHLEIVDGAKHVKLANDGKTILIPQPTDIAWDPLNWKQSRKYIIVAIMSLSCGMMDFGSAAGAVSLLPQSFFWRLPPSEVNRTLSANVISIGGGNIVFCVLGKAYGTLPVMFWGMMASTAFFIMITATSHFDTFFAGRVLSGFFSAAPVGIALYVIRDIFFFHEQAKMITWWASSFLFGPYLSPVITSLIFSSNPTNFSLWHWAFALPTIGSGLVFIAAILFQGETSFDRQIPESEHQRPSNRIAALTGIGRVPNYSRPSLLQAIKDLVVVFFKIPMLVANIQMMFLYAIIIGINSEIPQFLAKPPIAGGYGLTYKGIAAFYCAPVLGTLIGEILSRVLSDWSFRWHLKRSNGVFHAETRLSLIIMAIPLQTASLVILGFALQNAWPIMWAASAWCAYTICANMIFIGLNEYLFDVYPHNAPEIAGLLGLARTIGGFVISYYQVEWAAKRGADESFSTQAGILGFGSLLCIGLYFFGKRFRNAEGDVEVKILDHKVVEKEGSDSESKIVDDGTQLPNVAY